ncbi:MAG: restriction endonuclease subunit S [Planctomycetota bacterium]|nr:restriction endonuclease subunit S [Planctomycetota bacterium]MDA1139430.1 restriction endonuclease subunit S [Planctomycetota bacterium]
MAEVTRIPPEGWVETNIEELGDLISGQHILAKDYNLNGEGVPYITGPSDFKNGHIDVTKWTPKPKTVAKSGDVLVTVKGSGVGKTVMLNLNKACISRQIMAIRAPDISHRFLFHFLSCQYELFQRKGSSSLIPGIERKDVLELALGLPPVAEQKRIVAKIEELFSDLDAGVAALKRVQANLKRYRAAVLKAAVEGRLTEQWRKDNPPKEPASELLTRILKERRKKWEETQLAQYKKKNKKPPKHWKERYKPPAKPNTSDLPKLPDGWCWATVDQMTTLVTKGTSPNWQGYEYQDSGMIFLRSQNVRWGTLDLSKLVYLSEEFNETHQNSIVRDGDVLLNLVGASIGRSAIASSEIDGANLNQAVAIIRLCAQGLLNRLLVHFILSPPIQSYIANTKADVARANFNLDDVRPTPIPVPPSEEQSEICNEVEKTLSVIEERERQLEQDLQRTTRLRQSILKRAFEGKLVPQDPNDEPASALLARIQSERQAADRSAKNAQASKKAKAANLSASKAQARKKSNLSACNAQA